MVDQRRRRVLGVVGGLAALSTGSWIVAAREGNGESTEPVQSGAYWAVTADSAAVAVTSDADDDGGGDDDGGDDGADTDD